MPPKKSAKSYRYSSSFHRKYKKLFEATSSILDSSPISVTSVPSCVSEISSENVQDMPVLEPSAPFCVSQIFSQPSSNDNIELTASFVDPELQSFGQEQSVSSTPGIDTEKLFKNLPKWALSHKVTHSAINELLAMFKDCSFNDLPKDSRTLLRTERKIHLTTIGKGQFWYYGIRVNIMTALWSINKATTISLLFNIDGISPFKSSLHEFWPILFRIYKIPDLQPMVAAVYYGIGKPPLEEYFKQFVDELLEILENNIIVNEHQINVLIKCFVCDTPARCFIKGNYN